MSSTPSHSRDGSDSAPNAITPPLSVAMFKDAVGLGTGDSLRDVAAVAKYVALEHPDFTFSPPLPSVYDLEFEHRELTRTDEGFEQRTTFTVLYGDKPVQEELGTISIHRIYDSMPDTSTPLDGTEADDAKVKYTESPKP